MTLHDKMENVQEMNIEAHVNSTEARMSNMEVAMASFANAGLYGGGGAEQNMFFKEVSESDAISKMGKLSTPGEHRRWIKKFKNAHPTSSIAWETNTTLVRHSEGMGYICGAGSWRGEQDSDGSYRVAPHQLKEGNLKACENIWLR